MCNNKVVCRCFQSTKVFLVPNYVHMEVLLNGRQKGAFSANVCVLSCGHVICVLFLSVHRSLSHCFLCTLAFCATKKFDGSKKIVTGLCLSPSSSQGEL